MGPANLKQPSQTRVDFALVSRSFRAIRGRLTVIAILAVCTALMEAAIVLLIAKLATMLLDNSSQFTGHVAGRTLNLSRWSLCWMTLGLVVIRAVLDFVMIEMKARSEAFYDSHTRRAVADAYLNASWDLQSVEHAGGLQAVMLGFVSTGRTLLTKVADFLVSLVSLVIMLFASFVAAGWITAAVMAVMGIFAVAMRPIVTANRRASEKQRTYARSFSNRINETVTLSREIRVMGARKPVAATIAEDIEGLARTCYESSAASYRLQSLYSTITYVAVAGGLAVLIWVDTPHTQSYAAMVLLLYRAMVYGRGLQSTYQGMAGAVPYLEDLDEKLHEYQAAREVRGEVELVDRIESIRFDEVSFSYGNNPPALHGLSMEISTGEAIGVIGPSGAGKSTLVQLLLGLRKPSAGSLLVNGRSAESYSDSSWSRRVSFVPQEPSLFDQSVLDNVRCFRPDISSDQVVEALRAAHVLDEILALPDGLETQVGEDGRRLSGGQRQRVCIARALAGRPDLLILDEPTSALDPTSEEAVRETLESLKHRMTLVIVAHRVSTLRLCDRVLVIDHGRMEAFGDRSELERTNPYYAEALRLARLG